VVANQLDDPIARLSDRPAARAAREVTLELLVARTG
jgi:hypothetical protein